MKAFVGQTVLYSRWNIVTPIPATVVETSNEEGLCTLFVLDPNGPQMKKVAFSQVAKPGHWSFLVDAASVPVKESDFKL